MIHAELQACMPRIKPDLLQASAPAMTVACTKADIVSPRRLAAFLATCYYESGICDPASTGRLVEVSDGRRYEGRHDLGNVNPGDGLLFIGRGWIQLTGRYNYAHCAAALGLDLLNHPELLEQPEPAAQSAAWYWTIFRLNEAADQSFDLVTQRVNGACTQEGPSYQRIRRKIYDNCCGVLGAQPC